MDQKRMRRSALLAVIAILILLVTLTGATYAWFSSNRLVNTSRVEARTDVSDLKLLVSSEGGSSFRGRSEAELVQVNEKTNCERLMPVSTADLVHFVYNPGTANGNATVFAPVKNEKYYYHGRVYLMATGEGLKSGSRMALYLDEESEVGELSQNVDNGLLPNAARLGLMFGEKPDTAKIFYLSEGHNAEKDRVLNTVINGVTQADGIVLKSDSEGKVTVVDDPATALSAYSISGGSGDFSVPGEPLLYMDLDTIYQLDVFFYLEGCDGDCSDSISLNASDLCLAFYGQLA